MSDRPAEKDDEQRVHEEAPPAKNDEQHAQADEQHANENGARIHVPGVRELPLVALRETVIFPEMIVPLQVGREKSVAALNAAVESSGPIALVTQRQAEREEIEDPAELYNIGTLAKIDPLEPGRWAMVIRSRSRPTNVLRIWPFGRVLRFIAQRHRERDLVSYYLELEAFANG